MRYRKMGSTGLELSALGLGSWATIGERLDTRQSAALLDTAFELGINYLDTAETYAAGATERVLGEALARLARPRESYVISAKVYWGVHDRRPNTWGLSRKHVVEGCHASLRRLRLNHLDLLLCHRHDPDTPLAETVRAMSDLVTRGDVLYWGTSEWPVEQVLAAQQIADQHGFVGPSVEQLQYSVLVPDRVDVDYAAVARATGLGITAWSPLAYGLLTGRYDDGVTPESGRLARPAYRWLHDTALGDDPERTLATVREINSLARQRGMTPSRLALAWVLANPAVSSAICGASDPEHLRDNVGALDVLAEWGTGIRDLVAQRGNRHEEEGP